MSRSTDDPTGATTDRNDATAESSDVIDDPRAATDDPALAVESPYHWLFAAPRCRLVLSVLETASTPLDLATLAAEVTTLEREARDIDELLVDDVALALHHHYLPKMHRVGALEYDGDAGRVAAYPR